MITAKEALKITADKLNVQQVICNIIQEIDADIERAAKEGDCSVKKDLANYFAFNMSASLYLLGEIQRHYKKLGFHIGEHYREVFITWRFIPESAE